METLSVVVVTRNEAARIGRCLDSVAWADEVVVVDSESEDGTAALCRERGARVFVRPWPGYASQKNFGFDQATGDWILLLDADERVSEPLAAEIRGLLEGSAPRAVYLIPFKNYLGGFWLAHGGLYPDYHPRLFRRGQARYGAREIHEVLEHQGSAGKLQGAIEHLTYQDIATYLEKVNRYTTLEAEVLAAKGFRVRWWHLFKPLPRFFKYYVRKRGYQDGFRGLASAVLLAFYPFFIHVKVLERMNQASGRD
jgi:glycosyltransferase involved in cell wall biosynthesis